MRELIPIETVELPGVGGATLKKLRDAGIIHVNGLAIMTPIDLVDLTGMGIDTAKKAIDRAQKTLEPRFLTAEELRELHIDAPRLTTGVKKLDRVLGGGVELGAITELIGEWGVAKTQLCFQLCVTAQLPLEQGGFDCDVAYIDTENTFKTFRVLQIADRFGLPHEQTLKRIHVAIAYNVDHLNSLVSHLHNIIQEHNCKLIIIDSLMALFRNEFIGRGRLAERQQLLGSVLGKLLKLSMGYNVAVVVTNQMIATPESGYGNPNKPAGGHIMGHAGTYRVLLTKGSGNRRYARVIDSSYLPDERIDFYLTGGGAEDGETKESKDDESN